MLSRHRSGVSREEGADLKRANGIGYLVPAFIIARRNVAVATPLVMARSLRMTLERRKTAGLDNKLTAASELEKLMSEVISLREKVAQAELEQAHYAAPPDATTRGSSPIPIPNP